MGTTPRPAAGTGLQAVKERQRTAWESGDYARVGVMLQAMAERLVEAAGVRAGQRLLDVACGQGNAAIAGARRFADATGVDYVAGLLEQGRRRAAAERLEVTFTEGDAEALPFPDAGFDVVLSTVGVMFAPDQPRAAAELLRVTRPGGRIALASWTPDGMIGSLFRTIGAYAPPPPQVRSPMLWGTRERLAELFGDDVEWTALTTRTFDFAFRSPGHFTDWMMAYYGPIHRLAGTLDPAARERFAADLAEVPVTFDRGGDGTMLAAGEYLEAVGVRR
ncbi:methyltransferase domain-containing protein [Actinomadura sp. ATCC 31491]|uniref:Methyltransferase domain-containing protein n=1 Tax=Actinomadura luzonensis TaxID=2805427 RepID=A0ABT0FUA8_9ACTN|nr:methyltransferase domain-containing protein [Actinomadura luzonensis]MCK2215565.1 methyltransferase domain-containing protein [Actinomadura luzonensis]